MKIMFLIQSMTSGGAERVTANLANYWVGLGHAVTIRTLNNIDRDFYCLDKRVTRIAIELTKKSKTFIEAGLNNIRRINKIRDAIIKESPDIVISVTLQCNVYLAIVSPFIGRSKKA